MHVLLVNNSVIPVFAYGGTERVIWDLGKTLVQMGHRVSYLVPEGSRCDFARLLPIRPDRPWHEQVPDDVDIAHFQFNPRFESDDALGRPYLFTEHGNGHKAKPLPLNTVFVSRDHASRYGSSQFVHNGLDWSAYGPVDFTRTRTHFHFLGKAAWRVKNVKGAIAIAKRAGVELDVLGGDRFNFRRGVRLTFSRRIHFHGMVGGQQKAELLNASRGMVFPVRWHEPFGLAIIESMYFGCPVFATPYGALPELVPEHCGVLSDRASVLVDAIRTRSFDRRACQAHVMQHFSAEAMARAYLQYYERVLAGERLNAVAPIIQGQARSLAWHG